MTNTGSLFSVNTENSTYCKLRGLLEITVPNTSLSFPWSSNIFNIVVTCVFNMYFACRWRRAIPSRTFCRGPWRCSGRTLVNSGEKLKNEMEWNLNYKYIFTINEWMSTLIPTVCQTDNNDWSSFSHNKFFLPTFPLAVWECRMTLLPNRLINKSNNCTFRSSFFCLFYMFIFYCVF